MEDNYKMVQFGVVGTNWITDRLIEAAGEHPEFRLNAVYSRTEEKARAFAQKYGVENLYTSLSAMAESGAIDAVYIASPNLLHYEQSLIFIRRGIHVLCEKPMSTNYREGSLMVEEAAKQGVLLMQALMNTLEPRLKAAQDALPRVGAVRRITASRSQYSSRLDAFRQGERINTFLPEMGNGALLDLGIYVLQPLIHQFGEPQQIWANATKLSSGVDGQGTILADYGEMEAILSFSKMATTYSPVEVMGEEGVLHINPAHLPKSVTFRSRNGEAEDIPFQQDKPAMYYEMAEFIRLVEAGLTESPVNRHRDILSTLKVMDEYRRQIGLIYPGDK